jgi:hypothetical protein
MTEFTDTQAVETLTGEGYSRADVLAVIDSMIDAGLSLAQPNEGHVFTVGELDALRMQLGAEDAAYDQAKRRVQDTPELAEHEAFILDDWPEGEDHWQWVATAPVAEIVDWAEAGSR